MMTTGVAERRPASKRDLELANRACHALFHAHGWAFRCSLAEIADARAEFRLEPLPPDFVEVMLTLGTLVANGRLRYVFDEPDEPGAAARLRRLGLDYEVCVIERVLGEYRAAARCFLGGAHPGSSRN